MTGQSKTTNKRKNRPSQGETDQNITSSKNQKTNKSPESKTEVEELTRKNSELQAKINLLQIQLELAQKSNHLKNQLDTLIGDNDSQAEDISDDSSPPAKRQMRKKPSDEEEKAKNLIKTLLKTFPTLELDEKEIFTSQANNKVCKELVPELQKLMNEYEHNPSSEQVKAWLRSIHGAKRKAYLKSNQSNQQSSPSNQSNQQSDPLNQPSNQPNQTDPSNQLNSTPIGDDSQEAEKKLKEKKQSKLKNEEPKIEDGAKNLLKRLLDNTYTQDEYKLKFDGSDGTFTSQVNDDVCKKLIPNLIEDLKPTYDLSYKQVKSWLKSIHRSKRNAYNKSNKMEVDE